MNLNTRERMSGGGERKRNAKVIIKDQRKEIK